MKVLFSNFSLLQVDLLSHQSADLVAELTMKMETAKLELEAAVNQREAAKEALGRETARAKTEREELERAKAGLEEELSRKSREVDERATLLEAAAAQSVLDKEEIQALKARVCELGDSLLQEKTAHETTRREKEEVEGMLDVTFDEAIYMAWCKDKSMNLLVFPDPELKRAEFEAKEREDADLRADEL